MPIKIDVLDNSSQVRVKSKSNNTIKVLPETESDNINVKPKSNCDEIAIDAGCNVIGKQLDAKIDKEIEDRKAADKYLQDQLINKQDKIQFIIIDESEGIISQRDLSILNYSRLNKIIYNNNTYSLGFKDTNEWRYVGATTDPNAINTILINPTTGEYRYESIGNAVLQNHIADMNRHLRDGEREFWNNKLNLNQQGEVLSFNRN